MCVSVTGGSERWGEVVVVVGRGGGWGSLLACMDRSVIQRAHTVYIVELSVVPIGSGWGGSGASRIKTRAANRKWGL